MNRYIKRISILTGLFLRDDQVIQTHFLQRHRKELKRRFYNRQQLQHGGHLAALLDDAFGDAGNRVFETVPETV